jgi:hypothetical protein
MSREQIEEIVLELHDKYGMRDETAKAIGYLLRYGFLGEEMPPEIRRRWEQVNYIKDDKVILDKEFFDEPELCLIIMALVYEGYVERMVK